MATTNLEKTVKRLTKQLAKMEQNLVDKIKQQGKRIKTIEAVIAEKPTKPRKPKTPKEPKATRYTGNYMYIRAYPHEAEIRGFSKEKIASMIVDGKLLTLPNGSTITVTKANIGLYIWNKYCKIWTDTEKEKASPYYQELTKEEIKERTIIKKMLDEKRTVQNDIELQKFRATYPDDQESKAEEDSEPKKSQEKPRRKKSKGKTKTKKEEVVDSGSESGEEYVN